MIPRCSAAVADADLCFVVDPVDGTANFCAGLPLFGTMVAVVCRGAVVGAVIHDPVGDDTAWAAAGQGAWLETASRDRAALRVTAPVPLATMTGSASHGSTCRSRCKPVVCRNLPRLGAAWDYRCAAHQYRMLAAGHCHFSIYHRLMPWDHAAGWLLHREAGGWSAQLDGTPYSPAQTTGGLICAPDEAGWRALRSALFED